MILNKNYNGVRNIYLQTSEDLSEKSQLLRDESRRLIGGLSKKGSNIYNSDISENQSIS